MKLTDAKPTRVHPIETGGFLFEFGDAAIGKMVGAAYLLPTKHYYVRFKIIEANGETIRKQVSRRALTQEEVEHFQALARSRNL